MTKQTNIRKGAGTGPEESSAVIPVEPGQLQRPSFIPKSSEGTENITKDDIQMPRMALAQPRSPQLVEGDPKFIEDLKTGQLFNDLTSENFGKGPILFSVIRADRPRGVEFNPLDEGGGIKDFNVPLDDERMQFHGAEKPKATKFYDFVILLLETHEIIALSLKSSGLKTARQLNALIKLREAPIFAGKYELSTAMQKNAKSGGAQFAVYQVRNAGWVNKEEYTHGSTLHDALEGKEISINRDDRVPGADDGEEFPPAEEGAETGM